MPIKNAPVIEAMKQFSGQYPRFGARRIRVKLARQGIERGKRRCATLWAEAGGQVPSAVLRTAALGPSLRQPESLCGAITFCSTLAPTLSNSDA